MAAEAEEFAVLACGVRDVLFSFPFRMADNVFGIWLKLFWQSVTGCLRERIVREAFEGSSILIANRIPSVRINIPSSTCDEQHNDESGNNCLVHASFQKIT